jgi:hypothetical protein
MLGISSTVAMHQLARRLHPMGEEEEDEVFRGNSLAWCMARWCHAVKASHETLQHEALAAATSVKPVVKGGGPPKRAATTPEAIEAEAAAAAVKEEEKAAGGPGSLHHAKSVRWAASAKRLEETAGPNPERLHHLLEERVATRLAQRAAMAAVERQQLDLRGQLTALEAELRAALETKADKAELESLKDALNELNGRLQGLDEEMARVRGIAEAAAQVRWQALRGR